MIKPFNPFYPVRHRTTSSRHLQPSHPTTSTTTTKIPPISLFFLRATTLARNMRSRLPFNSCSEYLLAGERYWHKIVRYCYLSRKDSLFFLLLLSLLQWIWHKMKVRAVALPHIFNAEKGRCRWCRLAAGSLLDEKWTWFIKVCFVAACLHHFADVYDHYCYYYRCCF